MGDLKKCEFCNGAASKAIHGKDPYGDPAIVGSMPCRHCNGSGVDVIGSLKQLEQRVAELEGKK